MLSGRPAGITLLVTSCLAYTYCSLWLLASVRGVVNRSWRLARPWLPESLQSSCASWPASQRCIC